MPKMQICACALFLGVQFIIGSSIDWSFGLSGNAGGGWTVGGTVKSGPSESASCPHWIGQGWTTHDVTKWLKGLGVRFEAYVKNFEDNAIGGSELEELNDESLQTDFGVENKYHRKKIVNSIKDLRKQCVSVAAVRDKQIHEKFSEVEKNVMQGCGKLGNQVAPRVWEELIKAGVPVDDISRVSGDDLERVLDDMKIVVVQLIATERLTHLVLHQTAVAPDGSNSSLMVGAKQDLPQIMDTTRAARGAFFDLKSGSNQLVAAIHAFRNAVSNPLSESERNTELTLLQEEFTIFQKTSEEILANLNLTSGGLLTRAKERIKTMQTGALAVHGNVKRHSEVTHELQALNTRRKSILQSPEEHVQLAIKARAGVGILAAEIATLDKEISQLETELLALRKIRESKTTIIQEVQKFAIDANKKKQEWRDWHIRWCWAEKWGAEMDKYDQQTDQVISAQEKERHLAQKAYEALGAVIKGYSETISKKMGEKAKKQVASKDWNVTLSSEGLFAIEHEIESKGEDLQRIEEVLQNAMRDVGVSDTKAAVEAIAMSQKVIMLMSQTANKAQDVAHQVKAWKSRIDSILKRFAHSKSEAKMAYLADNLELVGKSFLLITHGHAQQMKLLDDAKQKNNAIFDFIDEETIGQRRTWSKQLEENESRTPPTPPPRSDLGCLSGELLACVWQSNLHAYFTVCHVLIQSCTDSRDHLTCIRII